MRAKILALNIGSPKSIDWSGKTIQTSMEKRPVSELRVSRLSVEGDSFANPEFHGTPDSVLYAFGVDAMDDYFARLSREYTHGDLGENLTLDRLDESEVSVGDLFKIGDVIAQATFPRIPCAKINFRIENPLGQKTMIDTRRSGVYFRVIQPGTIKSTDDFVLLEKSATPFSIREVYERMVGGVKVTDDDRKRVSANGAFPEERIARWYR